MNILIVGGSNSILRHSYVNLLKENHNVVNKSLGAISSVYGLHQITKGNLLKDCDVFIFDYFTNDTNQQKFKLNDSERVRKTLHEVVRLCALHNVKLLVTCTQNLDFIRKDIYSQSPPFRIWHEVMAKYKIPFLDVMQEFPPVPNFKESYYQDYVHLTRLGMKCMAEAIEKRLVDLPMFELPDGLPPEQEVEVIDVRDISNDTTSYVTRLVDVHYLDVNDEITVHFKDEKRLMMFEYICNIQSSYIEVSNGKERIHKNLLKGGDFVLKDMRQMVSAITFDQLQFSPAKTYTIKLINDTDVDQSIYDNGRVPYDHNDYEHSNGESITNLKLVSLFGGK